MHGIKYRIVKRSLYNYVPQILKQNLEGEEWVSLGHFESEAEAMSEINDWKFNNHEFLLESWPKIVKKGTI